MKLDELLAIELLALAHRGGFARAGARGLADPSDHA